MKALGLLWVVLASSVSAQSSISISMQAEPTRILNPGMAFDYGQHIGRRTELGVFAAVERPSQNEWLVGLFIRPQWSITLDSQWYPQFGMAWQGVNQEWQPWLGGGLQHRVLPEASVFADLHWQPGSELTFRLRLGGRIWFGRNNRLDARMRDATPVMSDAIAMDHSSAVTLIYEPKGEVAIRSESTENLVQAEDREVWPASEAEPEQITQPKIPQALGRYLHLGLFSDPRSAEPLTDSLSAAGWPSSLWFDPLRGAYRLLLGPIHPSQLSERKRALDRLSIDYFEYQKPEGLVAYEP